MDMFRQPTGASLRLFLVLLLVFLETQLVGDLVHIRPLSLNSPEFTVMELKEHLEKLQCL